jgi:hypothetical protein
LPEDTKSSEFRFGLQSVHSDGAKSLISPKEESLDPQKESYIHDLQIKSHQAYYPGEQLHRNYDWSATKQLPQKKASQLRELNRGKEVAECIKAFAKV